jgi:TnsA endonuclease-like protein
LDGGDGRDCPADFAEPVVSLRMADGSVVHRPLRDVRASYVTAASPWRTARSVRGQRHHPGYYWCATSGGHVIYESRLELARLMLADFDRSVSAVAAQPFWLRFRTGGRVRRHVPDFLLVRADQSVLLVNVKPAGQAADPGVAEALEWPGRLAAEHGWDYEVWTGEDLVFLGNVRFLAGYRRPWLVPAASADAVLERHRPGDTFRGLACRAAAAACPPGGAKPILGQSRASASVYLPVIARKEAEKRLSNPRDRRIFAMAFYAHTC